MNYHEERNNRKERKLVKIILILVYLIIISSLSAFVMADNEPIAYWRLEGNANEENNLYNGTVEGAVSIEGKYGNALYFDGVNDWVNLTDIDDFEGIEEISITAWVKQNPHYNYDRGIVTKRLNGFTESFSLYIQSSDKIGFRVDADTTVTASSILTYETEEWIFITAVYNSSRLIIYVNGEDVSASTYSIVGSINNGNSPLMFGKYYDNARILNGTIDEVRIFNRTLSQEEISNLYLYNYHHNTTCAGEIDYSTWTDEEYNLNGVMNQSRIRTEWTDCTHNQNYTEYRYYSYLDENTQDISEILDLIYQEVLDMVLVILYIGLLFGGIVLILNYNAILGKTLIISTAVIDIYFSIKYSSYWYIQFILWLVVVLKIFGSLTARNKKNRIA